MHELTHIYDNEKVGKIIFNFLYFFPQSLFLPILLLFFLLSWKIVLPILLLSLLPFPAYFRMRYEKRAFIASLYCMYVLNNKHNHRIDIRAQNDFFILQFKSSYYYFMWPFDIVIDFNKAMEKISKGERPYQDKVFDILDDILTKT